MTTRKFEQLIKYYLLKMFSFFISGKKYSAPELRKIKKILIVRQDNRIGNLLFVTPLIQMINQVTVVKPDIICGGAFNEIFSGNPLVDQVIVYTQKEFIRKPWKFITFISKLHKNKYDLVIDCKKVFSFNNALLTMMSRGYRIGFKNQFSSLYLDKEYDFTAQDHTIHESIFLSLPAADFLGVAVKDIPFMNYALKPVVLNLPDNYIAMHIGGRGDKSISVDLVNRLCGTLLNVYSGKIAVIYGPDEVEKAKEITEHIRILKVHPACINEMAHWISGAELFITPDTGPLHVASALNKKIAAIFSVTPSASYGPRTQSASLILNLHESDAETMAKGIAELLKRS